jgi:hypothetical protein
MQYAINAQPDAIGMFCGFKMDIGCPLAKRLLQRLVK